MANRKAPVPYSRKPDKRQEPLRRRDQYQGERRGRGWLRFLFIVALWGIIALAAVIFFFSLDLPNIRKSSGWERAPSITVLSESGTIVARIGQTSGEFLHLKDLPKHLIEAVIATEDRRFFHHFGVDPVGLLRAVVVNITHGGLRQGGSTITQQLAKNLFLSPEQTLKRKIQEAILAVWLDAKYSKTQILEAYLNRVYLGGGNYGVDAAAQYYFNKSARNVDLRESAILAGLLKAPGRFSPTASPARAEDRAETVMNAMVATHYITAKERDAALSIPLPPRRRPGNGDSVRYFADYVRDQAAGFLGGIKQDIIVQTTLNERMQQLAEQQIESVLNSPDAAKQKAGQGALLSMTPDGAIKALVGGKNYAESSFNRATQALRQPGSSFKPIIYLTALDQGMSPDTIVDDHPISFGRWSPGNYDGRYMGPVQLRDALAFSLNTVAIQILDQAGVGNAVAMAQKLGITSKLDANLSLALGTSAVHLTELTGAYATIASHGVAVTPYAIMTIKDRSGKLLYHYEPDTTPAQVVNPDKIAALTGMMTGPIQYGTGTAANIGRPEAGKTGTTNDYRDAWFMGFTPDLVTGVWIGNDDNSSMKKVTGGGIPARIWAGYMKQALAGTSPTPLFASDMAGAPTLVDPNEEGEGVLETPEERRARQLSHPQPDDGSNIFDQIIDGLIN